MKELTKGALVMTYMGLAWYDRIENGEHLVNPITWENDHLSPHFNASVATRAQVEAKVKEMGWRGIEPMGYSKGDWLVEYIATTYCTNIPILCEDDFDTAPAQLAEAILVAQLLNATKD
jgi:hypothetical protein